MKDMYEHVLPKGPVINTGRGVPARKKGWIMKRVLLSIMVALFANYAIAENIPVSGGTKSLQFADMNGDNIADMVAPSAILTGDLGGHFAFWKSLGTSMGSAAIGDFNKDGSNDVAAAEYVYAKSGYGGACGSLVGIIVFMGPTFTSQVCLFTGPLPTIGNAADLNADGNLDLVSAGFGSSTLRVYLGSASGTFAPGVTVPGSNGGKAVSVRDINGDNVFDLSVSTTTGVSTFFGNGNGTFRVTP